MSVLVTGGINLVLLGVKMKQKLIVTNTCQGDEVGTRQAGDVQLQTIRSDVLSLHSHLADIHKADITVFAADTLRSDNRLQVKFRRSLNSIAFRICYNQSSDFTTH